MDILIKRNTAIPTSWSDDYVTLRDNQTGFYIQIYEGEYLVAKHNYLLGAFTLDGIPPRPKGQASMKVTFEIDSNNILTVTAESHNNHKKAKKQIRNEERATDIEILKMTENVGQQEYEEQKRKERSKAQEKLVAAHIKVKDAFEAVKKTRDVESETPEHENAIENCGLVLDRVFKWMENNDSGFDDSSEYEYQIKQLSDAYFLVFGKQLETGDE